MKHLNKQTINKLQEIADSKFHIFKMILEMWNAETPHFGGCGPHRYDGKEKFCSYCNRPINWKPMNTGYIAGEVIEEIENKKVGTK